MQYIKIILRKFSSAKLVKKVRKLCPGGHVCWDFCDRSAVFHVFFLTKIPFFCVPCVDIIQNKYNTKWDTKNNWTSLSTKCHLLSRMITLCVVFGDLQSKVATDGNWQLLRCYLLPNDHQPKFRRPPQANSKPVWSSWITKYLWLSVKYIYKSSRFCQEALIS